MHCSHFLQNLKFLILQRSLTLRSRSLSNSIDFSLFSFPFFYLAYLARTSSPHLILDISFTYNTHIVGRLNFVRTFCFIVITYELFTRMCVYDGLHLKNLNPLAHPINLAINYTNTRWVSQKSLYEFQYVKKHLREMSFVVYSPL